MERKEFIKTCGYTCLGSAAMLTMLPSCVISKNLNGRINDSNLLVSLKEFETKAGDKIHYKKYIVIHNNELKYPICVYRFNENNYSALWMQCTHQGVELQVFGDKLQCPAHGSEFNNEGRVTSDPASEPLRTFPVSINNDQLVISLKAV
jgi:Rieske Fe-S protein